MYTHVKHLGRGSFGTVDLVKDETERFFARKVYTGDPDAARREKEKLQQLRHPHIVAFYEHLRLNGVDYYILEFCERGDLLQLRTNNKIVYFVSNVVDWCEHMFSALQYLNRQHLQHKDIKPMNILLDIKYNLKLCDFNLSKTDDTTGMGGGTARYCPPEDYDSPKGDTFSSALVIWELITREQVFNQIPQNRYFGDMPLPALNCRQDLADLVALCSEKDVHKRITSEVALLRALLMKQEPFYTSYKRQPMEIHHANDRCLKKPQKPIGVLDDEEIPERFTCNDCRPGNPSNMVDTFLLQLNMNSASSTDELTSSTQTLMTAEDSTLTTLPSRTMKGTHQDTATIRSENATITTLPTPTINGTVRDPATASTYPAPQLSFQFTNSLPGNTSFSSSCSTVRQTTSVDQLPISNPNSFQVKPSMPPRPPSSSMRFSNEQKVPVYSQIPLRQIEDATDPNYMSRYFGRNTLKGFEASRKLNYSPVSKPIDPRTVPRTDDPMRTVVTPTEHTTVSSTFTSRRTVHTGTLNYTVPLSHFTAVATTVHIEPECSSYGVNDLAMRIYSRDQLILLGMTSKNTDLPEKMNRENFALVQPANQRTRIKNEIQRSYLRNGQYLYSMYKGEEYHQRQVELQRKKNRNTVGAKPGLVGRIEQISDQVHTVPQLAFSVTNSLPESQKTPSTSAPVRQTSSVDELYFRKSPVPRKSVFSGNVSRRIVNIPPAEPGSSRQQPDVKTDVRLLSRSPRTVNPLDTEIITASQEENEVHVRVHRRMNNPRMRIYSKDQLILIGTLSKHLDLSGSEIDWENFALVLPANPRTRIENEIQRTFLRNKQYLDLINKGVEYHQKQVKLQDQRSSLFGNRALFGNHL